METKDNGVPTEILATIMGQPWDTCGNGMRDLAHRRWKQLQGVLAAQAQTVPVATVELSFDDIENLMPENEGNKGAFPCDACGWIQVSAQRAASGAPSKAEAQPSHGPTLNRAMFSSDMYHAMYLQELAEKWLDAAPAQPAVAAQVGAQPWVTEVIQSICEIPDRNSPEDEPEIMLVKAQELRDIITGVFESWGEAAPAPAPVAAQVALTNAERYRAIRDRDPSVLTITNLVGIRGSQLDVAIDAILAASAKEQQ